MKFNLYWNSDNHTKTSFSRCLLADIYDLVSTITKHDDVCVAVSESNLLVVGVLCEGLQHRHSVVPRTVSGSLWYRALGSTLVRLRLRCVEFSHILIT